MNQSLYKHSFLFFFLSLLIPWFFWFIAAGFSWLDNQNVLTKIAISVSGILGLVSPMFVALVFFSKDARLMKDLKHRLFGFAGIKVFYIILVCTLLLSSIVLAQAISLLFGFGIDQFQFAKNEGFQAGVLPAWFVLIIAPIVEELAWHSYGIDSLRRKFSLWTTTLIFAVYWSFWHLPLGFIKGYYQNEVANEGLIFSLNFIVSIFAYLVLANWLYMKTKRNIVLAIVFHVSANVFNEMFNTDPYSKIIQTGLLLILSIFVLIKERDLFFTKRIDLKNDSD